MRRRIDRLSGLIFLFMNLIQPSPAKARPEYAVGQKLNCTACHTTAWGGGPRILLGKVFGSHGHPPVKTSTSDLYYGDLRLPAFYPTKNLTQRSKVLVLMQAAASVNIPLIQGEGEREQSLIFDGILKAFRFYSGRVATFNAR